MTLWQNYCSDLSNKTTTDWLAFSLISANHPGLTEVYEMKNSSIQQKNFSSGLNCQVEILHRTSARFTAELPPSETRGERGSSICRWGVRYVRVLCCGSTHLKARGRKLTTPKVWIEFRLFKTLQTAGQGSEVRRPHSQRRLASEHKRAPTESVRICGCVGSWTSVFELLGSQKGLKKVWIWDYFSKNKTINHYLFWIPMLQVKSDERFRNLQF